MNGNSPPERLATATPSPTLSLASSDLNPSDSCTRNRAVCSVTIACPRKHSFPSKSAVLAPLSATQTRRQSLDARVPPPPSSIAGRSFGRPSGALSPASPPLLPCSRSNSLPTAALSPGPPSSPQMALPPKIHFSTHYTTATAAAEARLAKPDTFPPAADRSLETAGPPAPAFQVIVLVSLGSPVRAVDVGRVDATADATSRDDSATMMLIMMASS